MNLKLLLDAELESGFENKVAPTIACVITTPQKNIYENIISHEHKNISETLFDIASLTKPLVAILILKLQQQNKICLSDKVSKYLQNFNSQLVTIEHLMLHHSGIPVGYGKYDDLFTKNYIPCENIVYSDGNFILLGKILETLGGLENLLVNEIFIPLGMTKTCFNPLDKNISKSDTVKTEVRTDRGLVHGEVHDNKSFELGGVAGHAGIFSTATDLGKFVRGILSCDLISKEDVELFREVVVSDVEKSRTIGWVRKDDKDQMGNHVNDFTIFHTGFTGGELLINFTKQVGIVLLTNRVNPTRDNNLIFGFRKRVNNIIYNSF